MSNFISVLVASICPLLKHLL